MKKTRIVLMLAAAALVGGCATQPAIVGTNPAKITGLPSLRKSLQQGPVSMLLVHGMSHHPFDEKDEKRPGGIPRIPGAATYRDVRDQISLANTFSQEQLGAAVNANYGAFVESLKHKLGYGEPAGPSVELIRKQDGTLIGFRIARVLTPLASQSADRYPLKINIVNWSLGSCCIKEKQFGAWKGTPEGRFSEFSTYFSSLKSPINRDLKANLVTWGLGDAALYLGEQGQDFQECVATAIRQMAGGMEDNDRVVVITESLGSTIAVDTIEKLLDQSISLASPKSDEATNAATRRKLEALFASSDSTAGPENNAKIAFYMFANQYALLSVGRSHQSTEQKLAKTVKDNTTRSAGTVRLVAFTDPDDLLSFPMAKMHAQVNGRPAIEVNNVYVRNRKIAAFGFSNPGSAHLKYSENPFVLEAILDGTIR